jgi:hypothetical protein
MWLCGGFAGFSSFILHPSAFAPLWLLPDDHMCPNSKHLRFVG